MCHARSATTAGKVRTGIATLIWKAAIRHTLSAARDNAGHHTKVGFRPTGAVTIRIGGRHTTRIDLSAISSTKSRIAAKGIAGWLTRVGMENWFVGKQVGNLHIGRSRAPLLWLIWIKTKACLSCCYFRRK